MSSPDYSPFAAQYAQSRPGYPAELFSDLAALVPGRDLAWDGATGNGQAAVAVAEHFDRVIATDASAEQIRHAHRHPRVEYRVATSERSGLDDRSADLVTVASAIHWFDLDDFYAEVWRVIRPGGVLAAWTYHVGYVEPPFDRVFRRLYRDVLYPYFAPGARLVDRRYENITLPGAAIQAGQYIVTATWTLDQMLAFIRSWSGTQRFLKERGQDPVALVAEELERVWGARDTTHEVRWPIFIRVSRL